MGFFDKLLGRSPAPKRPEAPVEPVKPVKPVPARISKPVVVSRLAELQADFPFPLRAMRGEVVEAEVLRLRGLSATAEGKSGDGLVVILGGADDTPLLLANMRALGSQGLEEDLELAEKLDVLAWLAGRKEESAEYFEDEEQAVVYEKNTAPMTRLTVGHDYTKKPLPEVSVATVPVPLADPCELPVYLRFGGWNACPMPHVHMALALYWRERYGAEIVTVSGAIIEYVVARPPATDEQAAELALQQFLYCEDIVRQGVDSVATLARVLRHSTRWYFWWD